MDDSRAGYLALEERISAAIAGADRAAFDELAIEVYRFQRRFNEPYGQYCRALCAPEALEDWREIPPLPQAAFKHAELRTFPEVEETAAFRTSGTTGEGYGVHHFRSLRLYEEAILRGWDLLNIPPLPQIILIQRPDAARRSSLSHMMGVLASRAPGGEQHWCIDSRGALDVGQLTSVIDLFRRDARPVLVLGTALAFLHWFESGPNVALPPGSLAFETGGYKGSGRSLSKQDLYDLFARHLGLQSGNIINEYGMTELSSQCYARGLDHPHAVPPWVHAIAVNPATGREVSDGETGLLRIFDLANLGSVLAIQTRDLAIRRGSVFTLLGRDPAALPRGCSRAADELFSAALCFLCSLCSLWLIRF